MKQKYSTSVFSMKRIVLHSCRRESIIVIILLGIVFNNVFDASANTILRPWTTTETSLFFTQTANENIGSGWVGNTLTLNYGDDLTFSSISGISTTFTTSNFILTDVIGVSFKVSSSLLVSNIGVRIEGQTNLGGPGPSTGFSGINEVNNREGTGGSTLAGTIDTWGYHAIQAPPPYQYHIDISSFVSTSDRIATVQLLFTSAIQNNSDFILFSFISSGHPPGNNVPHTGSTVFADVSWILETTTGYQLPPQSSHIIPEPSTCLLFAVGFLGILGITYYRRWRLG